MVPTSWNLSFKCYRWKHSFFCLSSRDTWLLSHVTFSGGKTNLHDNRAEQRRRVWSGAMFVRIFLFVDKTETSWQTLNSEEQLKLKHRLIALLWCQRQHWDQPVSIGPSASAVQTWKTEGQRQTETVAVDLRSFLVKLNTCYVFKSEKTRGVRQSFFCFLWICCGRPHTASELP